ncbi:MAG: hypothetical protein KDL87_14360, partial [Verrucomicrobiae bacterium]|nr:hypothetical protein [Verrucomicrobiae bacterium]
MLKPSLRPTLACLLLVVATLGLPMLAGRGAFKADRFDESLVESLDKERPDLVLIGDSMLYTRLDRERLRTLAGERRVSDFALGGSASAAWYLYFRNVAMAAAKPPGTVVFFFRDDIWSQPFLRTDGIRREALRELSRDLAADLAVVPGFSADGLSFHTLLRRFYPIVDFRSYLRGRISMAMQDVATGTGSKYPLMKARRDWFDLDNLRPDLPAELPEAGIFHRSGRAEFDPSGTFLPSVFRSAGERGVKVILYRVKR